MRRPSVSLFSLARRLSLLVLLGSLPALTACHEEPFPALGDLQQPIVGGVTENGYQGVGALVLDASGYVLTNFCTATLLSDEWALTAAHCLLPTDDFEIQAWMTSFYVGTVVEEGGGFKYEADAFYPYPGYDPQAAEGDIGLVHLKDRVAGVGTYNINRTPLSDRNHAGASVFYVGYGVNNGVRDTGSGTKRSGTVSISDVYLTGYRYEFEGVMPCSGDSGGPGFMTLGGAQVVAGVVSVGDENCQETGYDTRVDAYADWIDDVMGGGGGDTNCDLAGGDCVGQACYPVEDGVFQCYPSDGIRAGRACNSDAETWVSSLPCADGAICLQVSDDPADGLCIQWCANALDCAAGEECSPIDDIPGYGLCVPRVEDCGIASEDCPAGKACYPYGDPVEYGCFESDEIGLHEVCDASVDDRLVCDDGLICLQVSDRVTDGRCFAFCLTDRDCDALDYCEKPIFRDLDAVGVCLCDNVDEDDYCAADDCDDSDPAIYPGAPEICDDGADNDCDGRTDEGCAAEGEGEGEGSEGEGEGSEGEGEGSEGEGEGEGSEGEGEGSEG
ncbi:MAG: trypsin-like serine protease, partial [Myxococcota bacterium]|nr:trypsin-like serine protease [Myxococcota bacterium]